MKKFICICLLALVLSGLCLAAGATGETRAVLASSENVRQGKTVAISVTLSDCDVVKGYTVELVYDKAVFELVGGTWQLEEKPPFGTDSDTGSLELYEPAAPGNSPILTFTLRAQKDAELDLVSEVSCNILLVTDAGEVSVPVQPVNIRINCPHEYHKNETAEYLKSAATCTEPAQYYKSCALCGQINENETFISGKALSHNFKDREMNKYLAQAGDCQNRNIYYVSCIACGLQGEQTFEGRTLGEHVYDNQCDKKCNVCFDERAVTHQPGTELKSDERGHWYECGICQGKVDGVKHIPGLEATPEAPQTCTECGYVISVYQDHVHEYGDWVTDGEKHWRECACGEIAEEQAHQWDTTDPALHSCPVCGQTKEIQEPPTQPTQPSQPVPPEPEEPSPAVVIVLGVLLLASLIGNVVLTLRLMKRKKK